MLLRVGRLWLLGWVLFAAHGVRAQQDVADAGSPQYPVLKPPVLIQLVAADYPEAARAAGTERTVPLRLSIDAEGRVTDAQLIEPDDGSGFGEAARAAALQFRFEPARRDELAVSAIIRFDYEFRLPPPAAPVSSPPAPVVIAPPEAAAPAPPPAATKSAIDVTVKGASADDRMRRSAEAVQVVSTAQAQSESSDLASVLNREPGIHVRRSGGLGSTARVTLNGLGDDRLRMFLDGVPLELAGYGLGLATVPVNLVKRAEVYRGVVPLRFGTDALGGAINLVSNETTRGTSAGVSAGAGSFSTYQLTGRVHHGFAPSGIVVGVSGFLDDTDNDYPVDVEVADERGRVRQQRLRRFHDRYAAYGGSAQVGVVDQPWADRLIGRVFTTHFAKDVQNNVNMSVPYGEVETDETSHGGTLSYDKQFGEDIALAAVGGVGTRGIGFRDRSRKSYDWFGRVVFERPTQIGELGDPLTDVHYDEQRAYGRISARFGFGEAHTLRLMASTNYTARSGKEKLRVNLERRDPQTSQRDVFSVVSGAEYQWRAFERRLENILFVKDYVYRATTAQVRTATNEIVNFDRDTHRLGAGDGLRFELTPGLALKASYEYATRLPDPREVFGDGVLVKSNVGLRPERSHNVNLAAELEREIAPIGKLHAVGNFSLRRAKDLITLMPAPGTDYARYDNVVTLRALGVDGEVRWTSPRDYVELGVNATWLDLRNVSTSGPYSTFQGERLPNQPWLYGNGVIRLRARELAFARDQLSLHWSSAYVHNFFPSWENVGNARGKARLPNQVSHSLVLQYAWFIATTRLTGSFELQNLTDARLYDYFGVQKPGRAVFIKLVAELDPR